MTLAHCMGSSSIKRTLRARPSGFLTDDGDHLALPRDVRSCKRSSWEASSRSDSSGFDCAMPATKLISRSSGALAAARPQQPLGRRARIARRGRAPAGRTCLAGVDVASGSRSERKCAPFSARSSITWSRWLTDRANRSRRTISVSSVLSSRTSLERAGRAREAPEPYSWTTNLHPGAVSPTGADALPAEPLD